LHSSENICSTIDLSTPRVNKMTLYVSDLDGTLLRTDKSIARGDMDLLNRCIENGVCFTYASARSYSSASPLVKGLNLSIPAVTFNGVFLIDPRDGRHIVENVFTPTAQRLAESFFDENNLAPLVYSYIDGRERVSYLADRLAEVWGYVSSRQKDKRLRPVNSRKELYEGNVFYFTLFNPSLPYGLLNSVFGKSNGFSANTMQDTYDKGTVWYEIFGKDASKANALSQLRKLVRADRVVCFGDNTNDISMIRAADVGICVSNGCDELKSIADIIIGGCDEGAVIRYIADSFGGRVLNKGQRPAFNK